MRLAEIDYSQNSAPSGVDLVVIELAALFHDLFDRKYESALSEKNLDVRGWLSDKPISKEQVELILKIIANVSYSKEMVLRRDGGWTEWHQNCLELHCVMDADKLDAVGAFGVFRCAAFSGAKNIPLYVSKKDKDYRKSAVGHFDDKLFKLEQLMMTPTGRKVASRRTAMMVQMVRRLEEEAELLDFDIPQ